jgi:hypothetical protein
LRNYQLHLVDQGTSPITLNATITGLTFFWTPIPPRTWSELRDGST